MVNAFTKRIASIFDILNTTGEDGLNTEEGRKLLEGCDRGMPMKMAHSISMAIDDHIEGEVGFEAACNEEGKDMATHAHK